MPAEETPPAPPSADQPAAAEGSPAGSPDGTGDRSAAAHPDPATIAASPERRRFRRRRRRRPPRPAVENAGGEAAAAAEGEVAPPAGAQNDIDAADDPVKAAAAPPAAPDAGERPHRRRRRRRRPPSLDAEVPGDVAASTGGAPSETGQHEAASGDAAPPPAGTLRLPRPPRPRRRHLPHPPGLRSGPATAESGAATPAADEPGSAAPAAPVRRLRSLYPRRRRPRAAGPLGSAASGPADGRQRSEATPGSPARGPRRRPGADRSRAAAGRQSAAPERRPAEHERADPAGPDRARRGPVSRDRRDGEPRGRGQAGGRGDPRGRRREAPDRRAEIKLYALEALVDRGFEDIADETEEGATRRVHWTIVKRSVADQKTGKAMSATYVLQRDGGETEFPNLGAARAVVNKTIIHPEKLTLSKAEHAAAKNK